MDKTTIRKSIQEKRLSLDYDTVKLHSSKIFNNLLKIKEFIKTDRIYIYCDFRNEVNTEMIIEYCLKNNIEVCVPKIIDKTMLFYQIKSLNELDIGYMGIREPKANSVSVNNHYGVVIVPGTAFDNNFNRMGYGGGYYDRFLSSNPNLTKIGIAYNFQILDTIPTEFHDIKMDYIVTNNNIIKRD